MTMPSVEWIVTFLIGIVSLVVMIHKKLGAIKWPKAKTEETALLDHIRAEKDLAITQRDECTEAKQVLDQSNRVYEDQIRDLLHKMERLERRLFLLENLNRRLSAALDETRSLLQAGSDGLSRTSGTSPDT